VSGAIVGIVLVTVVSIMADGGPYPILLGLVFGAPFGALIGALVGARRAARK
jgi:ribose/xylose/arabinose/galactoside ABC-type transport system permease subunit